MSKRGRKPGMNPSENADIIVHVLLEEMEAEGISSRKMETILGIGIGTMRGWSAAAKQPTVRNLRKWAEALGFDLVVIRRRGE